MNNTDRQFDQYPSCLSHEAVFKLQKQAWGGHDFIVRDPDGNAICFAGRADQEAPLRCSIVAATEHGVTLCERLIWDVPHGASADGQFAFSELCSRPEMIQPQATLAFSVTLFCAGAAAPADSSRRLVPPSSC